MHASFSTSVHLALCSWRAYSITFGLSTSCVVSGETTQSSSGRSINFVSLYTESSTSNVALHLRVTAVCLQKHALRLPVNVADLTDNQTN